VREVEVFLVLVEYSAVAFVALRYLFERLKEVVGVLYNLPVISTQAVQLKVLVAANISTDCRPLLTGLLD